MIHLFKRAIKLSQDELSLLARCWLLLSVVRVGLWFVNYGRLQQMLIRREALFTESIKDRKCIRRIVYAVESAGRFVPAATCLTKALVARKLLREAGQPANLRIGVRKMGFEPLAAHAWLEIDGEIVLGGRKSDLSGFTVLKPVEG